MHKVYPLLYIINTSCTWFCKTISRFEWRVLLDTTTDLNETVISLLKIFARTAFFSMCTLLGNRRRTDFPAITMRVCVDALLALSFSDSEKIKQ